MYHGPLSLPLIYPSPFSTLSRSPRHRYFPRTTTSQQFLMTRCALSRNFWPNFFIGAVSKKSPGFIWQPFFFSNIQRVFAGTNQAKCKANHRLSSKSSARPRASSNAHTNDTTIDSALGADLYVKKPACRQTRSRVEETRQVHGPPKLKCYFFVRERVSCSTLPTKPPPPDPTARERRGRSPVRGPWWVNTSCDLVSSFPCVLRKRFSRFSPPSVFGAIYVERGHQVVGRSLRLVLLK